VEKIAVKLLQDQNVSRKLAFAFGCVVVSVVAANGFIFMSNKAVDAAGAEAEETLELIRRGESVLEKALDAQGDLRGLYATANQDFAGDYREGVEALDQAFAQLRSRRRSLR
jgi:CHASE3 domain sensor protein